MKKVVLLATGGTIAGRGKLGQTTNYQSGALPIEELLESVPGLEAVADLEWVQVANVNSDDLTGTHWLRLVEVIEKRAQDPQVAGFVITHGTDTLEETAYFLHVTVKTKKPVVLTGAMRPATALSADGPRNLYAAVTVAASQEAVGRGVLVVFGDQMYGAQEVQKVSTFAVEAFQGRDFGALGYILGERPCFYQRSERPHTVATTFTVKELERLPRVEICYFAVDAGADLLEYAAGLADGLVLAGAGNGNYSCSWNQVVGKLAKKNFPVVRCSRIGNGEITPDDGFDQFPNVLLGGHLPPQKAKILLQLVLTKTRDLEVMRDFFARYS